MINLFGTNPSQVPTNADLGTLAYQDADSLVTTRSNSSIIAGGASNITVDNWPVDSHAGASYFVQAYNEGASGYVGQITVSLAAGTGLLYGFSANVGNVDIGAGFTVTSTNSKIYLRYSNVFAHNVHVKMYRTSFNANE
jgi:hypothetical protein